MSNLHTESDVLIASSQTVHPPAAGEKLTPEEQKPPEIANFITVLSKSPFKDNPIVKSLHHWENSFFSFLLVVIVTIVVIKGTRRRRLIPAPLQNFLEFIVETFDNFLCDILGKKNGRHFLPFIGSLFIFIFVNNILGLIPLFKSPTSSFRTTVALGIITFFYVQFTAVRVNGVLGYLYHLAGSPKNVVTWLIVPLMLPLHIIGELAKPLSLSLRLFGNILGEDSLLGAFVMLGIVVAGFIGLKAIPLGVPLQLPFFFLALLMSTVQAMVFALLATVYILLVLPHDEET